MQIRSWRPEPRSHLAAGVVGFLVLVGLCAMLTWLAVSRGFGDNLWLFQGVPVLFVPVFLLIAWRKGELTPIVVTVDDEGVAAEARPAKLSWRFAWHELGLVGTVRDPRGRQYVVFVPADGRERGTRTLFDLRLAQACALPAHARVLVLSGDLATAVGELVAGGLRPLR